MFLFLDFESNDIPKDPCGTDPRCIGGASCPFSPNLLSTLTTASVRIYTTDSETTTSDFDHISSTITPSLLPSLVSTAQTSFVTTEDRTSMSHSTTISHTTTPLERTSITSSTEQLTFMFTSSSSSTEVDSTSTNESQSQSHIDTKVASTAASADSDPKLGKLIS